MKYFARLLIALAIVGIGYDAYAADFSAPILDGDGHATCVQPDNKVIDDAVCPAPAKLVTLAVIARNSLYAQYEDEKNISGDEKYKRAELAAALTKDPKLVLKAEDIALLKKLIARSYGPLVVHQSWQMLDPGP